MNGWPPRTCPIARDLRSVVHTGDRGPAAGAADRLAEPLDPAQSSAMLTSAGGREAGGTGCGRSTGGRWSGGLGAAAVRRLSPVGVAATVQATPSAPPNAAEADPRFRVLFARDAESEINVLPLGRSGAEAPLDEGVSYPLTARGVVQAWALGRSLADEAASAVVTSPRLRCVQTADAVGLPRGLPIRLTPELVEIGLGEVGRSDVADLAAIAALAARWAGGDMDVRAPGGESLREVRARSLPFVTLTIGEHGDDPRTLVVVSHGGLFGALLPAVFGNVSPGFALRNPLPTAGTVRGERGDGGLVCSEWLGRRPR